MRWLNSLKFTVCEPQRPPKSAPTRHLQSGLEQATKDTIRVQPEAGESAVGIFQGESGSADIAAKRHQVGSNAVLKEEDRELGIRLPRAFVGVDDVHIEGPGRRFRLVEDQGAGAAGERPAGLELGLSVGPPTGNGGARVNVNLGEQRRDRTRLPSQQCADDDPIRKNARGWRQGSAGATRLAVLIDGRRGCKNRPC